MTTKANTNSFPMTLPPGRVERRHQSVHHHQQRHHRHILLLSSFSFSFLRLSHQNHFLSSFQASKAQKARGAGRGQKNDAFLFSVISCFSLSLRYTRAKICSILLSVMMNPFLIKLQLSEDDKNKNITTKALFLLIIVYKRLALSSSLLVKCCNRSKHWSSLSSFLSLSLYHRAMMI